MTDPVWQHIVSERKRKDLQDQVEDWKGLHRMFSDAQKLPKERQTEYLHQEVYPRLKEYCQKYKTKYDHLNRPNGNT